MPTILIWLMVSCTTYCLAMTYSPENYVGHIRDNLWRRTILVLMWPAALIFWALRWSVTLWDILFSVGDGPYDDSEKPIRDALKDIWLEVRCMPQEFAHAWQGE